MKLGEFDEPRAKSEAISFLAKSIYTLSSILGIDVSSFEQTTENPYPLDSPYHVSFNCLKHEVSAYNKLVGDSDE